MQYMVCCVAVSPMRALPAHRSEMVSQQLFGEKSILLEAAPDNWAKIKSKYDGYEGWVTLNHLTEIDEEQYVKIDKELTAEWVNQMDYNGYLMQVPLGSSINSSRSGTSFWNQNKISFNGKRWNTKEVQITPELIKEISHKYLNTAYLWGGKSPFGIDCSGFSQMVYKFLNVPILRDASMQAEQGEMVGFLQSAKCGDLAYFDNEEGRITHVGILLNEKEIIHSSGKVRIDKIDSEGILNLDTKQRTHKLRIIRRYF